MAPSTKGKSLLNFPPPEKPEEESDEEEEEEEEESEEEDGGETEKPEIVEKQAAGQTAPAASDEEDSKGDESEEESEEGARSPSPSDFTIKAHIPQNPAPKRALEGPESDGKKDSKSKKRGKVGGGDWKENKSPKGGTLKVWSEEDEIHILRGFIDFRKQNGADPPGMPAFLAFLKGKLQLEATTSQLYEKVRRLKEKYFKNAKKIEDGEDPFVNKPHERKRFDLSKRIWGGTTISDAGANGGDDEKSNMNGKDDGGKVKKSDKVGSFSGSSRKAEKIERKNVVTEELNGDDDGGDGGDFEEKYTAAVESYRNLAGQGLIPADLATFLKENRDVVGSAASREFEQKWKELLVEETEMMVKRYQLRAEHAKLVLKGIKKW